MIFESISLCKQLKIRGMYSDFVMCVYFNGEESKVYDTISTAHSYGKVIDVFIPKPFRSFAFVTFADAHVAEQLLGDDHIIKGISVHIGSATPKRIAAHPQHHQSPAFPSSAFNTLMGGGRAFRGQSSAFGGPAGASSVPSLGNSVAAAGFGGMQFGSSGQMAGHAPYWPVHNAAASASFSQMHAAAAPAGPPPHNSNAGARALHVSLMRSFSAIE